MPLFIQNEGRWNCQLCIQCMGSVSWIVFTAVVYLWRRVSYYTFFYSEVPNNHATHFILFLIKFFTWYMHLIKDFAFFWKAKTFFKELFIKKSLPLCMVIIQERYLIDIGLWWCTYRFTANCAFCIYLLSPEKFLSNLAKFKYVSLPDTLWILIKWRV